MSRRIAISTIGSHGDVQPFVALGVALMKRGHSVILGASSNFVEFVTGHGLEFHSLGPARRLRSRAWGPRLPLSRALARP